MFRSSSVRSGHVLRAVAFFVSLFVASPSQNHPSGLLASSRRVFDAKGLAFQAGGGCNGLISGSTQWSCPGQGACRGCATCQSWPEHLRLVQRLGCKWVQPHTHDGRASQRSLSLMQRQGGLSACGTSWSVLRSRAVLESRCRPVLNLASSTSFRDDEESKPLSDFEETRRRRELKVDIDDAEPHKSPELPRGGELEVYMVYTWDGDLMPSGRGFNEDTESDEHSLADGEYAVYNDDGDEAIKFMPWKLSGNTDSWDTYDMDLVDPMSIRFAQSAGFSIPDQYDWNATTSENYRAPPMAGQFFGKYKKVRERMDYSYHVNYVKSRQVLQDEIVTHWREEGTRVGRPWVIFTAGAMGAGKSHTIKMLEAFGCCSLTSMVKVDPDTVKYQLPEMQEYIKRNPGPDPDSNVILAGHATHNESAFLQELIVREMLEENKSMIIDGSLSNAEWYRDYISMIRSKYPHFRIGIVHVVCDADIIWKRVQERCARTGRCIQRQVVDLSVKMAPKAVEMLTPLTDFVTVVRSDGDLKDDKVKTIVFKHVREELLADQLEDGHMKNCDLDMIRRLREEHLSGDGHASSVEMRADYATGDADEGGETVGANIDLLERLLAGR